MTDRKRCNFGTLYVYWCPRCNVQSERPWHFCKKGPALIPQLDEETHCERIEVVPVCDARVTELEARLAKDNRALAKNAAIYLDRQRAAEAERDDTERARRAERAGRKAAEAERDEAGKDKVTLALMVEAAEARVTAHERTASLACDLLNALQPWGLQSPEVRSAATRLTVALAALTPPSEAAALAKEACAVPGCGRQRTSDNRWCQECNEAAPPPALAKEDTDE